MRVFTAGRLLTPTDALEHPLVLVEQGRVLEISCRSSRQVPAGVSVSDLGDGVMAPGYVDLHLHGSAGYDVMDDTAEALPAIEQLLVRHGVTSYFPTTVTAPMDITLRALERLADAIETRERHLEQQNADDKNRAFPLGIHLEGPFISHARRGVHPAENLLAPSLASFEQFWQAARGRIRVMTIAPELEGAPQVIAEATQRGVCVSLGHSDADFATAERGIAAGAHHATHTFNAMRPLDHRSPGILGAVLTDRRVSADIIADGVHLDPAIVKLVADAKGPEQTVLITDAVSATGMPDGRYRLGSFEVDVRDGKCTVDGKLAGSVLSMDRAVRNLAHFAQWDLPQAVTAASRNPARVARVANKGVLAVGADADFVVLSPEGEILHTFIGGVECSRC
ncbi:MAG TPA: N-acetylglucosamine-6-phosphate deacetylase [Terriglobales bacterium]|jgi:N-acetylglucosamine-6-phosphate deacetylase|nr:N-acetylglucosamine-6-phosphate deacetylase [Terriglobales bacterium]